jgi:uncharacterized protein
VTDAHEPEAVFGVATIDLDLPPLVGALSRRLYEAGLPITPARAADFARALTLVRPIARRRLYWTARSVFVSDPSQVNAFDAVWVSVFGKEVQGEELEPEDTQTLASPPDERPPSERKPSLRRSHAQEPPTGMPSPRPGELDGDEDQAEVEVPLALASDEERLRSRSFDALEPHELAELYRLMSRLELATPRRLTRRYEKGRHGEHIDLRRTLRASLRTGGDPIRLARRHRRVARRRLVMLCDISGSMEPYARAYLQFLTCAAGSGPNAGARDPARRCRRARLVEWDPDRRRAEGVQRPPRTPRDGPGGGDRDPLRWLGAWRPDARRPRDGAPCAAGPSDRVGESARRRR